MSCACGHHHPQASDNCDTTTGTPIPLSQPMIALQGRLICADAAQMMTALSLLPDHIALSRAEPGCLQFDLWQDEDPLIWHLSELFTDANAFAAHQARTRDSLWGRDSTAIIRDFQQRKVLPLIRAETPADETGIEAVNRIAFGGEAEAKLIRLLRDQGDLSLSLVAQVQGTVLGHIALSPLSGDHPGFALAPVAVMPKAQGLGIGGALIRAAMSWAGDAPVVVLGDPGYYARFGFAPANLNSPYAGPYLQAVGDLPPGSRIQHAPAFQAL